MNMRQLTTWLAACVLALAVAWPRALTAQETAAPLFKKEELQQILAPIALYPDQLLARS